MVIKKMNSIFHKHSRWLFGVLTVIIIVSFLGFLTPGRFGMGGFSSPLDRAAGEAYGEKITYRQVFERMRSLAVLRMLFGGAEAGEEAAFWTLCLDVKAEKIGLTVDDGDLISVLRNAPFLCKDGKYSPESYKNLLALLRANGMNEADLLAGVRCQLLQQKLLGAVSENITVTDSEVKDFYREKNTVYTGKVYTFKPAAAPSAIPTEEVQDFFEKNRSRYILDGSVEATLVEFPFAARRAEAQKTEKDVAKIDEKAKTLTLDAANDFACEVYDALKSVAPEKQNAAFQEILKTKKLKSQAYKFAFNSDKSALKNGELALLNASDPVPVSDAFTQDKTAVVGFVVKRVEPRQATFAEVQKKVFGDVKESRTRAATIQAVKDFAGKLAACKSDAEKQTLMKSIPAAKVGDVKFSEMGDSPSVDLLLGANAMLSLGVGEAAAVGDQLAVLTGRTPPAAPMTEEIMTQYRALCRRQKITIYCYQLDDDISNHCKYNGASENRFDR